MTEALAVYQPEVQEGLAITRAPEVVLSEAKRAAAALGDVIRGKAKPVIFNGEQYLEFEDWQTVGRFYGVTAKVVSTASVTFGDVIGFEARAVVVRQDGAEISAADSMCLNDEPNWKDKPLFQLRSMAQTRACSKALRNVLAWVVVLAGYKPTPAEEMDGVRGFSRSGASKPGGAGAAPATTPGGANIVKGVVTEVSVKSGSNTKGPWTKYGVKVGGIFYNTFSATLGAEAQRLKGGEAVIEWKANGEYRDLVGIVGATAEQAIAEPDAAERTAEDEAFDRELAAKGL